MVTLNNAKISILPRSDPQIVQKQAIAKQPYAKPKPKAPDVEKQIIATEKLRKMQMSKLDVQRQNAKKERESITKQILEKAAEKLRKLAEYISEHTHLTARDYSIHEGTKRITVRIYDSVTGEVIREVPGNEFLDRVAKMEQLMGKIFDNLV